jgi:hypothetical protein
LFAATGVAPAGRCGCKIFGGPNNKAALMASGSGKLLPKRFKTYDGPPLKSLISKWIK